MRGTVTIPGYLTKAIIHRGLNTAWVGKEVFCFGSLKSTNDYAFRLAEGGAAEGTLVVADEQTAGRGRFGRPWYSPPGLGLWCSLVLRPDLFPWEAPKITMAAALAAARAIRNGTGLAVSLKWPNDVLLGRRKVCGILTELNAEADSVNFVILGIGLNVNHATEDFPHELRTTATSLRIEAGRAHSRVDLLQGLLQELESTYEQAMHRGFSAIREEIKSLSCLMDKTVAVRLRNRLYRGRVMDIDGEGGLVLRVGRDGYERIISGEVTLIEEEKHDSGH